MISTKLQEYLGKAGVPYTSHYHSPAYSSQEIAHSLHIPGRDMVKPVILNAGEERLIMAVLSANDTVNLDILRREIGCDVLRLASEAEFSNLFATCELGAMPPFGNIFNVPVYCEVNLSRNREIEFNAGTHHETIRMRFDDYKSLATPKMVHFARPYAQGLQRLAA